MQNPTPNPGSVSALLRVAVAYTDEHTVTLTLRVVPSVGPSLQVEPRSQAAAAPGPGVAELAQPGLVHGKGMGAGLRRLGNASGFGRSSGASLHFLGRGLRDTYLVQ